MPKDFGVYSRSELWKLGYGDADLRRRVHAGSLHHVRHGWYATPSAFAPAVASARKGAALSCVSALEARGFWLPPGYGGKIHLRGSKYHQARTEVCRGYGPAFPVTSAVDEAPMALVYAAKCMRAEDWIAVCDSVMNSQALSIVALQEQMPVLPQVVRDLMDKCDPLAQSGTESIVRVRLRALGFTVEVQAHVDRVGYVDLRVGRLLIECDSMQHHMDKESYQKDRQRDRRAHGNPNPDIPFRITYDDVIFGWQETLEDLWAITKRERHRRRNRLSQ